MASTAEMGLAWNAARLQGTKVQRIPRCVSTTFLLRHFHPFDGQQSTKDAKGTLEEARQSAVKAQLGATISD